MAKVTPTTATATKPTKAKKEPKVKKVRPAFTGTEDRNEDGEYTAAMPAGFEIGKFKPLKPKNFASKKLYYEHKRELYLHLAEVMKKRAESPDDSKLKRLDKQVDKMSELIEQLKAAGQDVTKYEALVKAMKEDVTE